MAGLDARKSFVSTGPMLDVRFNNEHAGKQFALAETEPPALQVTGSALSGRPLDFIEIIVNGRVDRVIKPSNSPTADGGFETLIDEVVERDASFWVAVRCFEAHPEGRPRFAHTNPVFVDVAGKARNVIWAELQPDDAWKEEFRFCWIVDFPMYERDEETGELDFSHNPFSMPQGGLEALETMDPLEIKGYQYDIVCNGVELSSGAIRNHRPEIMYKAFEITGKSRAFVDEHFGGMISAFRFGAPPHGGIAPGVDRIVMLLAGAENIREVIMFPMNQRAEDLMMQAPSEPTNEQLRELGLRLLPQE